MDLQIYGLSNVIRNFEGTILRWNSAYLLMAAFRHFAGTAYLGIALFFYNFQLQVGKPMESCLFEYTVKTLLI